MANQPKAMSFEMSATFERQYRLGFTARVRVRKCRRRRARQPRARQIRGASVQKWIASRSSVRR
jgi:hypothetical protein